MQKQVTAPIIVFYHAHCLDGYAAAWAAWKSLGDQAKYQAVMRQQPMPTFPKGADLYIKPMG